MSLLTTWGSQIIFLVLFATLIEAVLPQGELRSYTKMVLGLVVVVAILSPLLNVVKEGAWVEPLFFAQVGSENVADTNQIVQEGIDLSQRAMAETASAVESDVEREAAAYLYALQDVTEAAVDIDGNSVNVTLYLNAKTNDWQEGDLMRRATAIVSGALGITPEQVEVQVDQSEGGQKRG